MKSYLAYRNIVHTIITISLLCGCMGAAHAQMDAIHTGYMFNSLTFNPGYAGSKEFMTMNLIHRSQWVGINGAPSTQSLTMHSPVTGMDRIALGASVVHHQVGTSRVTTINGVYAFRIPLGKSDYAGKLSMGIQGGMTNWRTDFSEIEVFEADDEAYGEEAINMWLPNFGVGMYYYTKHYFLGASLPNLLQRDLRTENVTAPRNAQTYRHYYVTAGGAIPLKGEDLVLKPMAIFRSVAMFSGEKDRNDEYTEYGAPRQISLDLSLFIKQKLWVGTAYRTSLEQFSGKSSHDSANLWAAYYFENGLNFGLSYDYGLTAIQQPAKASFEVMLGYDFNVNTKKAYHPRYF